jgi:nicotinic acid mononucleotide adenylyltransferase
MPIDPADFDLSVLLPVRRDLAQLRPEAPPSLRFVVQPRLPPGARLAILPGSYNPPTTAHLALADAALASGRADAVLLLLATRTVNKEKVEGMALEDRLLLLRRLVAGRDDLGIVLVNRGLYVDQAEIAWHEIPGLAQLWFIVGFDKIVQIFDPRYYADRDQALDRLFALSAFLVAPRGHDGAAELEDLLDRPENRRYRARVERLDVPPDYRDVSSSNVRTAPRGAHADVPPPVKRFLEEYGVYEHDGTNDRSGLRPDRYGWRLKVLDLAEAEKLPGRSPPELAHLWKRSVTPGAMGDELRGRIARGEPLLRSDLIGGETGS